MTDETPTPGQSPTVGRPIEAGPSIYRFGACELDERLREVRVTGHPVPMEAKPFEVLLQLLRRPGETLTKDELLDAVWPGRVVTEGVLTKSVMKLRALIGDSEQEIVRTVHGFGYRIGVPVERREAGAARAFEPRAGDSVPQRPHWRFVRALGEGGYALVWLAEHAKTREARVFKYARDGASLTALKREVTIYRLLHDTPGADAAIVRIIDWNVDEPPYHVESEYVAGGNLAEWFAQQRDVPLATRLDLIAQCAEAVAAAHRVGVLHKDLKPGNVLVRERDGASPAIVLCDFGIGMLIEPERLAQLGITRHGFTRARGGDDDDTSGTPVYLAPEVAMGQAPSTRSDVYALGVMLYQLVVGDLRRPLGAGWERDVEDPLLREDIALAADVDPTRRLADAAELAQRLRRLEARRADRAAADAAREQREHAVRAAESLRRNRRVAFALAAVMTIAAAISLWFYRDARAAQREAEAQAQRAARQAETTQAINTFLNQDLLSAADPYGQNAKDTPIGEVVEKAVPLVAQRLASQPAVAGEVYRTLGTMLLNLGRADPARETLDRAIATLASVHGADALPVLEARLGRAEVEDYAGRYDEHLRLLQALHRDAAPRGERDAFAIKTERYVAWGEYLLGHFDLAEKHFRIALARGEGNPDVTASDHAFTMAGLSLTLSRLGRPADALPLAQRTLELRTRALGPDHPETLNTQFQVTAALMGLDRATDAVPILEDMHRRYRERFGVMHYQNMLAAHELGVAYLRAGRPADAVPMFEEAAAAKVAEYGELAGSSANTISWLGLAQLRAGDADAAARTFARLDAYESKTEYDRRTEIGLRRNIGELRLVQQRAADALASCRAAFALAEKLFPEGHVQRATSEACIGLALRAQGKADEGDAMLARVLPALEKAGSQGMPWRESAQRALASGD